MQRPLRGRELRMAVVEGSRVADAGEPGRKWATVAMGILRILLDMLKILLFILRKTGCH